MSAPVPASHVVDVPPLILLAELRQPSLNTEKRTVDVAFYTGAQMERFDWESGDRYLLSLSMKKGAMRLDRLNAGAPFLNAHASDSLNDVIGVIEPGTARLEGGQALATVRLSKRATVEPIWQDIQDGILRNVSVGARIYAFEQTDATATSPMKRMATDWEPFEVSAVPIGADPGAKIQAAAAQGERNPCVVVHASTTTKELMTMEPTTTAPGPTEVNLEYDPPKPDAVVLAPVPNEHDAGAKQERERVAGIINATTATRMPLSTAQKFINEGTPLLEATQKILEMLRGEPRGPGEMPDGGRVTVTGDPLRHVWDGIRGALLHRIDAVNFPLDDNARMYRSRSVLRCAEECLEQRGIRTRNMSKLQIAGLALGFPLHGTNGGGHFVQASSSDGYHSTSDFPNILADVANKTLRRAYDVAPATWTPLARQITMPDFKSVKRNQLGEAPALLKVLEHGEFTRGTVAEGKEEFQLATWGRIFGITRQALVNDDLDAFGRLTMSFGRSARNLESDVVWYQILKNATMGQDGIALFDATTHKNLTTGPGTVISVDSIGVGYAAIQVQTALDGATFLNLTPRYLMVPPSKITLAMQYTSTINPNISSAVNPFAGVLIPISEPRLSGGVTVDGDTVAGSQLSWYMSASPDQVDIIEYGYLDGNDGPVVETRLGFDIDALEIKCRHDFAAKVIDWRGLYKNVGA